MKVKKNIYIWLYFHFPSFSSSICKKYYLKATRNFMYFKGLIEELTKQMKENKVKYEAVHLTFEFIPRMDTMWHFVINESCHLKPIQQAYGYFLISVISALKEQGQKTSSSAQWNRIRNLDKRKYMLLYQENLSIQIYSHTRCIVLVPNYITQCYSIFFRCTIISTLFCSFIFRYEYITMFKNNSNNKTLSNSRRTTSDNEIFNNESEDYANTIKTHK